MDGVNRPEIRANLVEIKDPFNQTVRCYRVQGTDIYFPPFPNLDDRMLQFPDLQARDDDILICGYPKCGKKIHVTVKNINRSCLTNFPGRQRVTFNS